MLIITGRSNKTTNEVTVYIILCRDLSIRYVSRKSLNFHSRNTFLLKNKTLKVGIQGDNPHIFP